MGAGAGGGSDSRAKRPRTMDSVLLQMMGMGLATAGVAKEEEEEEGENFRNPSLPPDKAQQPAMHPPLPPRRQRFRRVRTVGLAAFEVSVGQSMPDHMVVYLHAPSACMTIHAWVLVSSNPHLLVMHFLVTIKKNKSPEDIKRLLDSWAVDSGGCNGAHGGGGGARGGGGAHGGGGATPPTPSPRRHQGAAEATDSSLTAAGVRPRLALASVPGPPVRHAPQEAVTTAAAGAEARRVLAQQQSRAARYLQARGLLQHNLYHAGAKS